MKYPIEIKEQIAEIIGDNTTSLMPEPNYLEVECKYNESLDCKKSDCPNCNGTGYITKPLKELKK